jgi:diketogulonate reductase-like aldo/keto reductase
MTYPSIVLNNGVSMPQIGLGVWQAQDGAEVEVAVTAAIKAGYRLIDTAAVYGNEAGVGRAIAQSGIPREELFITTKVWNADQGYDKTIAAFDKSLKRLSLDYVDLYLIHWPAPAQDKYIETWRALEQLYHDGKVRAIGVSNFTPEHLEKLLEVAELVPAVNQIELHPQFPQLKTRAFCKDHGIAVESYSPLGSSKGHLLTHPVLVDIGEKYNKSAAQVMIRWHIQNGLIVIPKSVHPERIAANINVFDFELSPEDMTKIASLATNQRIGADPNTANFT